MITRRLNIIRLERDAPPLSILCPLLVRFFSSLRGFPPPLVSASGEEGWIHFPMSFLSLFPISVLSFFSMFSFSFFFFFQCFPLHTSSITHTNVLIVPLAVVPLCRLGSVQTWPGSVQIWTLSTLIWPTCPLLSHRHLCSSFCHCA